MNEFKKSDYCYTALFCEENIWHLTRSLIDKGIKDEDIHIIFLSNKNKHIAVFNQLSAKCQQAVIWDYHVILMVKIKQSHDIFDFDSRLPFATHYEFYIKNSLPDNINSQYQSQFRIIPAKIYLKHFYSDRSHMKGVISAVQFPDYPAILSNSVNKISLNDLLEIGKNINKTLIIQTTEQLINWVEKNKAQ